LIDGIGGILGYARAYRRVRRGAQLYRLFSPEVDKLVDQPSMQSDPEKRKKLVWEIERLLAEDGARPVIFYPRGGTWDLPPALCEGLPS